MHGAASKGAGIRDMPDGTSVSDLLTELDLSHEETYAVLLNDLPVSIEERDQARLSDGDKFTVFPPIKGG